MAYLGDKNVGDIVKIKENGVSQNFIIVHKGKPSSMYDDSCDGVWLLREKAHTMRVWDKNADNDYENSDMKTWLDGTYLNTIDEKIREAIKTVKIPYRKGSGTSKTVTSGANGLSCKVFLLSGYEVGFTTSDDKHFVVDGAVLTYFNGADKQTKRICNNSKNTAVIWWLRSPCTYDIYSVWIVLTDGNGYYNHANATDNWARPAFVLPSSLLVNDSGDVSTNTLPTITSDKTGDLGTLTDGLTCKYSVNDLDAADSVNVTLTLDEAQKQKFAAVKEQQYTYELTGNEWLKITNGSHTLKISATDGKDTTESTATFTRNVDTATVTLTTPLEADDMISACSLNVAGSIPADAVCKYEVTNNANDSEPAWEDCTNKSKAGLSYAFKNKTAQNGFAFNFRVSIKRGMSGIGGYIEQISGGFE